jgi:hypothetical protein
MGVMQHTPIDPLFIDLFRLIDVFVLAIFISP